MLSKIAATAALSIGLACLGSTTASAETMNLKADLNGSAETPPSGSKGTGTLTGTYDTSDKKLTYTVEYFDLTGPATAAHFHGPAPAGKSAPVEVGVKGSLASPIKGSATLTEKDAADLLAGNIYFNIHTAAHKGGEVRGQVEATK